MTQPKPYTEACQMLAENHGQEHTWASNKIDNAMRNMNNTHTNHTRMLRAISDATLDYTIKGYADLHTDWPWINAQVHATGWGHRGFTWQRYFKDLSVDMQRPFVMIGARSQYTNWSGKWRHHRWNFIRVPKRKYTEPLLEMFTIMPDCVCRINTNTVSHEVMFQTDDWTELTGLWKERCLTQPSYRAALRLDV